MKEFKDKYRRSCNQYSLACNVTKHQMETGINDTFAISREHKTFSIYMRSLDIEPTSDKRPITELRVEIYINNFENSRNTLEEAWDNLDRELPLAGIYS